jgi:asparagine synthase (glutamine-hydrolysing)
MCGINGILGLGDQQKAGSLVRAMNKELAHRGPDDEGMYMDEEIALGHRRLSIIDLSAAGHQPLFTADKRYCIVYNGELYNYRDLQFELKRISVGSAETAYAFSTNTDTEVILASYLRWGKDCVKHFNGMFAFAIWDSQLKTLFIARDRIGIKPFYYYVRNKLVIFSSEIRAILGTGIVPRKADPEALADYLRYQTVHAPRTIIQGIGMLMPGHSATICGESIAVEEYWAMNSFAVPGDDKPYETVCADVHELLLRAVERRLVSDVPFGAFLSGGIDSSIIVGLMSKVALGKVKTFTVTFDEQEFNEARFAKMVASKFNTEHNEIKLNATDFLKELPDALKAMDHPSGDGANSYIVSKATRQAGISMALSGLGGDELFAGYDIFRRSLSLEHKKWIATLPYFARAGAGKLLKTFKPGISSEKIAELLKLSSLDILQAYPLARQVMMDHGLESVLKKERLFPNAVKEILARLPKPRPGMSLSAVSLAEAGTYMQNTLLRDTDQMSMAVALEVRVPFLDHTVVEYVLALKDKYKYPSSPKKLLVDAAGVLLPNEIVNRPKMGFTLPWSHWLKNDLKAFCEEKMEALGARDAFDKEHMLDLWKAFLADDPRVKWSNIWYLVALEFWLNEHQIDV